MNIVKRLAIVGFLGLTTMTSVACGLETAVSDIQSGLIEAAKKQAAQKGFQSAVSGVTNVVIAQAVKAITSTTAAPAPNFSPLAVQEDSGSITIDETSTVDGGTMTNKGTITYKSTTDDVTFAMTFDMTFDMNTVWTGLKFTDDSGKELASNGDLKVGGNFAMKVSGETFSFTGTITEKGTFTVDGKTYTIDIVVTITDDTMTYTGTINGEPISGSFENESGMDDEDEGGLDAVVAVSCQVSAYECVDYTGAYASFDCSSGTESSNACATATIGSCAYLAGTDAETNHRYYTGYANDAAAECEMSYGTWYGAVSVAAP